ncbi:MAG: hypothetical protein ABIG31_05960 [Candidatus Omnitrophota bacterium]
MDKKEIYEHLAKIYLDASLKKHEKSKKYPKLVRNIAIVGSVFLFAASVSIFFNFIKKKPFASEVSLVLLPDAAKINYHFDPARKEIFSLDLNKLDLTRYKALKFFVKKANYNNVIALRVEFINNYKEKSEIYFKDLPARWQDYTLNLSDFKGISDWSQMINLSFAIEEWNAQEKKGIVYIDNVRVLK